MATVTDRESLLSMGQTARRAARQLARHSEETKNQALANIADLLESEQGPILEANRVDHEAATASGMDEAMLDRLLLNPDRLTSMAKGRSHNRRTSRPHRRSN